MSKLRFQELALRHGLRHPDMIELADVKGITAAHDLETPEGREAAVAEFKRRSSNLFGPPDSGKSMMQAMAHMGSADGAKESESQRQIREASEEVYARQVRAFHAEPPKPEKPVSKMSAKELDEYQRKVIEHGTRALAQAQSLAELRKALRG